MKFSAFQELQTALNHQWSVTFIGSDLYKTIHCQKSHLKITNISEQF